jgi:thiol-disulfide isomerase/thioredoxin
MSPTAPLLVACLCAAWCKTCDAYRDTFAQVARSHPGARFVWVDIEDHSDALGDAPDIDNFPTLAILQDDDIRFFGPLTPHAATLDRLVAAADTLPPVAPEPVVAQALQSLAQRLPSV